jgi:hypothetical protein
MNREETDAAKTKRSEARNKGTILAFLPGNGGVERRAESDLAAAVVAVCWRLAIDCFRGMHGLSVGSIRHSAAYVITPDLGIQVDVDFIFEHPDLAAAGVMQEIVQPLDSQVFAGFRPGAVHKRFGTSETDLQTTELGRRVMIQLLLPCP